MDVLVSRKDWSNTSFFQRVNQTDLSPWKDECSYLQRRSNHFPCEFPVLDMTQDVTVAAREANKLHPNFLSSCMIILPFCHHDESVAVVLVNPVGITCSEMLDRTHLCMIILNSGSNIDPPMKFRISQWIRNFLNMASSMIDSGIITQFTSRNYKAHEPDGAHLSCVNEQSYVLQSQTLLINL